MSSLRADLPSADAQITYQVLDAMAATVQAAGLADGRGRGQLRADIFADLFRDLAAHGRTGTGGGAGEDRRAGTDPAHTGITGTDPAHTGITETDPADTDLAEPGFGSRGGNADDAGRTDGDITGENGDDDAEATCAHDTADTAAANTTDAHDPAGTAGADATGTDAHDPAPIAAAGRGAAQSLPLKHTRAGERAESAVTDRSGSALPVCVNVYVSASTLAGWDDEPGELAGCGVISAEFARALAESADTIRTILIRQVHAGPPDDRRSEIESPNARPPGAVLPESVLPESAQSHTKRPGCGSLVADSSAIDPGESRLTAGSLDSRQQWTDTGHSTDPIRSRTCGTVLDAGRAVYRPGRAATDYVTTRDRTCAFPGCRSRATRCDLDHRLAYRQGGATCPCNIDALCRFHHLVKTFTCWSAIPGPADTLVWIGPTGRRYPAEPGHLLLDNLTPTTAGSAANTSCVDADPRPDRGAAHRPDQPDRGGSARDTTGQRINLGTDPPPF